jgi:glycosyltransferase involved in cell wall biosynthesis
MIVSIIITSYNHEEFIASAINSFLSQSFKDFELIIIDDASNDNSVSVIKSFTDKRIKTVFLDKNVGFCRAANIGIEKALGKYVKIFASDDIIEEGALIKQVEFLDKNPQYGAVFSRMTVIDESGQVIERKTKRFDKYFLCQEFSGATMLNHFFFKGNFLAAPSAIIRRDELVKTGGFDERIIQAHDFDLWVRLCLNGCQIYIMPERLVKYRRLANDRNMSANTKDVISRLVFDNEKILENFSKIKDIDFLIEVFPNLESQKHKISPELVSFCLAQEALKVNSVHHKQFALLEIFKVLGDKKNIKLLEENFNFFVNKDFVKLVNESQLGTLNSILNQRSLYRKIFKKVKNKCKSLIVNLIKKS